MPSPSIKDMASRGLKLEIGDLLKRADSCLEHQDWGSAATLYRVAATKLEALDALLPHSLAAE